MTFRRSLVLPHRGKHTSTTRVKTKGADAVGAGVAESLATAPSKPGEPAGLQQCVWVAIAAQHWPPVYCSSFCLPSHVQTFPLAHTNLKLCREGTSGTHGSNFTKLTYLVHVSSFNYTHLPNKDNWKPMIQPNIIHYPLYNWKNIILSPKVDSKSEWSVIVSTTIFSKALRVLQWKHPSQGSKSCSPQKAAVVGKQDFLLWITRGNNERLSSLSEDNSSLKHLIPGPLSSGQGRSSAVYCLLI